MKKKNKMIHFTNFKPGAPVSSDDRALNKQHGVLFLFDENGNEWYESQKLFSENTLKIAYDSNGVIRSISKDVSMLWPNGLSVAEVSIDEKTDLIDISGGWRYENGEVIKNESSLFCVSKEDFEEARSELLDSALKNITLLHVRLLLKMPLTKEENEYIHRMIGYMDNLNALDSNNYKTLELPDLPEVRA